MVGFAAAATTTGVCLLAIVYVDEVFKMKMDDGHFFSSTRTEPLKTGVEILDPSTGKQCRLKYQKTSSSIQK